MRQVMQQTEVATRSNAVNFSNDLPLFRKDPFRTPWAKHPLFNTVVGVCADVSETDPDLEVEPGETVYARPVREKIHLFDGRSPESKRIDQRTEPIAETD